ncbi:hypothetical protein [uncultured Paraglaciecola sp.]|uniref:hypothetical protein n=1 Tax=uncultured Paraglaciecola sp. TaxID=1765024 RepID=UPI00261E85B4|nr:hypothetical protein [uncultured Paraglaciecola sp.]
MSNMHVVLITAFLFSDRRLIKYAVTINSDTCGFDFHEALKYYLEEEGTWISMLPERNNEMQILSVDLIDGHLYEFNKIT